MQVLGTLRQPRVLVREFLYFNLIALCHSQVTLMLCTDINITETTYSCQFQYVFGNQLTAVKVSNFSDHYPRNRSTLDIGVLGYIGIV